MAIAINLIKKSIASTSVTSTLQCRKENMIYSLHNQFGEIDMKKYIMTLTGDERDALGVLASKGKHKSQKSSMP